MVCTAAGTERGKIGSVSVVVNYLCFGQPFCLGTENRTQQFQFDCTQDNTWNHRIVDGEVRSLGTADFSTTPSDMCGQCVDPDPEFIPDPNDPRRAADPDNHCLGEWRVCVTVCLDEDTSLYSLPCKLQ